jgi:hypothetical protein
MTLHLHVVHQCHCQDKDAIKALIMKFHNDKLTDALEEAITHSSGIWKQDTHFVVDLCASKCRLQVYDMILSTHMWLPVHFIIIYFTWHMSGHHRHIGDQTGETRPFI